MIEVKNITKSYGDEKNKVAVLKNISFSIKEGSFVVIMGTSGSGKTTLLNCISGIEMIDSGEILYEDKDISKLNSEQRKLFRRSNLGMVFQSFDLLPILNVRENILLPIKLNHLKLNEDYFNEIVKTLGIEAKLKNRISELSGGQQQRVAIARALITRPKLICADEPTGNLDRKNTIEVMNLFKKINIEMNTTILMITHDNQVAEYGDEIITIDDGRIEKWK
ncbi:MAG: ABC transporter ATP-binding protein [Lachnospiraceae bacterium]|nr:ABC transporter ATP-binding protein [Lachnospiraceae bacterium]MDD7049845.1 ABC transporter ATP-binding protein [Lachnospiraceae bacterium]MDY4096407.1 ABC transporter ATP-binding protein [Lachnospiraceae bacterium]